MTQMMHAMPLLLFFCFVVPAAAPDPAQAGDHPLGRGHHAKAAIKVAIAILYKTLPKLLKEKRLIQRGTHYVTDGKTNPLRKIVASLVQVNSRLLA